MYGTFDLLYNIYEMQEVVRHGSPIKPNLTTPEIVEQFPCRTLPCRTLSSVPQKFLLDLRASNLAEPNLSETLILP